MKSTDIQTAVDKAGGKFITVYFVKVDGSLRMMNCRRGVTKALRGGEKRFKDSDYNLVTVFDMVKKEYRSFKKERVFQISIGNKTHLIEDFDKNLIIDMDTYNEMTAPKGKHQKKVQEEIEVTITVTSNPVEKYISDFEKATKNISKVAKKSSDKIYTK